MPPTTTHPNGPLGPAPKSSDDYYNNKSGGANYGGGMCTVM
jgi:hypothetical protein